MVQLIAMYLLLGHNQPQLFEYEQIAVNLLTKHTFVCHRLGSAYYSLVPPLYPLLCAATYLITNYSHLAMLLVQITLVSLTCVIVYLIGSEIFNKKVGMISAVLCIFHPGLIICSTTKIHELSLVAFMFSLLILTILKFEKNLNYKKCVIIGILIGACMLTRASIILFIPLFLFWLLFNKNIGRRIRDRCSKSFLIIIITGIVILPWVVRNYYVHHKFVFMQTPSIDIWVGNNINATGSNYSTDGKTVLRTMSRDFIDKIYAADELTKDKIFREEAYQFVKNHPYKFVNFFFKKLYYFWWFSPQTGLLYPHIYLIIYKVLYSIIFFSAAYGIVLSLILEDLRVKRKIYLLLLFFLAISVLQSIFYVEGRHRWAIEPILLVFTAQGLILGMNTTKKYLKIKMRFAKQGR